MRLIRDYLSGKLSLLARKREADREREWADFWQHVAERRAVEELKAREGAGTWVPHDQVHPQTNVADRLYRTTDGSIHRAMDFPLRYRAEEWFFPRADS